MPVIVRVSVSRKLSKDFQSKGFSLDITSELPAMAVEDPQTMADASGHLFQLAQDLLEAEVSKAQGGEQVQLRTPVRARLPVISPKNSNDHPAPGNAADTYPARRNGNGGGNGSHNGNDQDGKGNRLITQAQVKAINNMATRLETNGDTVAQEDFGCTLNKLTIKQASQCIDNLKQAIEAGQPQGASR